MQRTQIYFPESLHEDLKIEATIMNLTLSEYLRTILKERSKIKAFGKKNPAKKRVRLSLLAENAINLGKKDLARNFDKYFEASLK